MPTVPTRQLVHGATMPVLGFGTSPMLGAEAAEAVREALEAGYRLVDTAENYRNEEAVGQGIRNSGIDRSEIFLTTKFNRKWHSVAGVNEAYTASLERLGVDYLDLLLVHWPNSDQDQYVEAFRGLGQLLEAGLVRAIGCSNFKPKHLQRVFDETGLVPDVNQIQLSPYTPRQETRAYDDQQGIVTESWSPIGASSDELRNDPAIVGIAERLGRTPTQVVLRWHVQQDLIPIPKSATPSRIAENLDVFDFELSDDDLAAIAGLDRGEGEAVDSDVFGH